MPSRPASARSAVGLGVAAGLLNVNFLLEWLLDHRTPLSSTVVSDLAIPGRPWSWAFRLGDVGSALALLVLCALAWRRRGTAWRVATAMLGVFALTTLLAVAFPEHCPASAAVAECATDGGWADVLHDAVSTAGTTCGILAAAVFAWALRRESAVLARSHITAALVAGALGIVFVWAQTTGHVDGIGWVQRAQIVTLSAWFAVVGWSVAEPDAPSRATGARPDRMRS